VLAAIVADVDIIGRIADFDSSRLVAGSADTLSQAEHARCISSYRCMALICRFADSITQLVLCASQLLWYLCGRTNARGQQDAALSVIASFKPGALDKSHHRQ
jgi:hypothetical protein